MGVMYFLGIEVFLLGTGYTSIGKILKLHNNTVVRAIIVLTASMGLTTIVLIWQAYIAGQWGSVYLGPAPTALLQGLFGLPILFLLLGTPIFGLISSREKQITNKCDLSMRHAGGALETDDGSWWDPEWSAESGPWGSFFTNKIICDDTADTADLTPPTPVPWESVITMDAVVVPKALIGSDNATLEDRECGILEVNWKQIFAAFEERYGETVLRKHGVFYPTNSSVCGFSTCLSALNYAASQYASGEPVKSGVEWKYAAATADVIQVRFKQTDGFVVEFSRINPQLPSGEVLHEAVVKAEYANPVHAKP